MIPFKIIRKIGKMLRGGAGKKEIFLGALLGVLIGFNPTASLTLFLAILIALLLNANIGFTLLGVAVGKISSLLLSVISFHTGFFLIHKIGLEGLFTKLSNAPVTALMDLNVYAMIGSLPFAIVIGILFGKFMSATVTKIREQMVKAGGHDKVGKAVGNKFSKFLMWLAFGKQKISTADVLAKESPMLRKSGVILVAVVLVIGLLMQFLLVDKLLKKGIETSIASATGAEVNVGKAHFSLGGGKLEIENLQVTDPDKPTHDMARIGTLAADLSVSDLLRRTYTIDALKGSVLERDVARDKPGKVYVKEDVPSEESAAGEADEQGGKSLEAYLAKAGEWKKYGEKAHEYLKERKDNAEAVANNEQPKASKDKAVADAKRLGYLKAAADLVADRPAWTIRVAEIDRVRLGSGQPEQVFRGAELSSHPELNGQPTTLELTPQGAIEPTAKATLRFDDPAASHQIYLNVKNVDITDAINTGDRFVIEEGVADIKADGTFTLDALSVPFTLMARDLKTSNEALNQLRKIELPGELYGSLLSPRVKVELDDQLKDAVVDAAKERAKDEVKKAADKEINKALESEEAQDMKKKLKGFF